MKIAFVDTFGIRYDDNTVEAYGLGGSESAVVYMSRELSKLGLKVTVFNSCEGDRCSPGTYNNVQYIPIHQINELDESFDVVVVLRSVSPFINEPFASAIKKVKHKVLQLHDTFCTGDDLIEYLINTGAVNEIFTLTDWHTSYISNCNHGVHRNYDILKNHIYQTRNGVGALPRKWVDISKKDPDLFVYNASVTKGMIPLVTQIWPEIKKTIPSARLKVIGGYYRMDQPDQQELDWNNLVLKHPIEKLDEHGVEFTGVIPQKDISDILQKATFFLYPAAFPETFGISTLEALNHNVVPITCRFGALEETAIDLASFKMNYTIQKNWSCSWLNEEEQIQHFIRLTIATYHNKYLLQQKQHACNQVKGISGWDSVALQWKQHLYHKLGQYLPLHEYKAVQDINTRVRRVFGRRFLNLEELTEPKNIQQPIRIITPVFNAEKYIANCILSVASQDYDNYEMIIIDDVSTDNTVAVANQTLDSLSPCIRDRFTVYKNTKNVGALCNQVRQLEANPEIIYILLDGDDTLVNNPNIFHKYNNLYREGFQVTYGSCWSVVDNIPLIAQEYPPEVKQSKTYRQYKFTWNMPYTHLRTFSGALVSKISQKDLTNDQGIFYKAGGDGALFYALLEAADPDRVTAVADIVYNYNDASPINDYKINSEEQTRNANEILKK